jgi:hypothetical protein
MRMIRLHENRLQEERLRREQAAGPMLYPAPAVTAPYGISSVTETVMPPPERCALLCAQELFYTH